MGSQFKLKVKYDMTFMSANDGLGVRCLLLCAFLRVVGHGGGCLKII